MPQFLESKLQQEAKKRGFDKERANRFTYGTMNRLGYMKGSKETAAGKAAQRKHERDVSAHGK